MHHQGVPRPRGGECDGGKLPRPRPPRPPPSGLDRPSPVKIPISGGFVKLTAATRPSESQKAWVIRLNSSSAAPSINPPMLRVARRRRRHTWVRGPGSLGGVDHLQRRHCRSGGRLSAGRRLRTPRGGGQGQVRGRQASEGGRILKAGKVMVGGSLTGGTYPSRLRRREVPVHQVGSAAQATGGRFLSRSAAGTTNANSKGQKAPATRMLAGRRLGRRR